MKEEYLHELACKFMDQFPNKQELSLDEFLIEYHEELTEEQRELGNYILELFYI